MSIVKGKLPVNHSSNWGPPDVRLALILAALAWFAYGWLVWRWQSLGVFRQFNIIFDTDPNSRMAEMSHGWSQGGFVHPLLWLLFSFPLRMIAGAMHHLRVIADPAPVREVMLLCLLPLLGSIKLAASYAGSRALGGSRGAGTAVALLTGFSFGPAVFGALPEHFAVSGAALTCVFAWAGAVQFGWARDRFVVWIAFAVLLAGLTFTNLVPVLILFYTTRFVWNKFWWRPLVATFVLAVFSAGITLAVSRLGASLLGNASSQLKASVDFADSFFRKPGADRAMRFLPTLAYGIAAPVPAETPNLLHRQPENRGWRFVDLQFSYDAKPVSFSDWMLTFGVLGIVGLGAWKGCQQEPRYRPLAAAALLTLAFHWILHTLWGSEWFLYSMHWHAALLTLLAGWVATHEKWPGNAFVAALCLIGIADSVWVLREMLGAFARAPLC
jgi:hypothetical protein